MIQFDMKRFGRLAQWTLVTDRAWYLRTGLMWLVIMSFLFILYTTQLQPRQQPHRLCIGIFVAMMFVSILMGAGHMFLSMKGQDSRQRLMVLPASNLEKYLMRYLTWVLLIPLMLMAFVGADLLQYIINVMLQHENTQLLMARLARGGLLVIHWPSDIPPRMTLLSLSFLFWIHSVYAVGATFFRSHKYNWVFTSVVLILVGVLLTRTFIWFIDWEAERLGCSVQEAIWYIKGLLTGGVWLVVLHTFFLSFAIANFWLSFRLFCRTQLIGRFFNT